MLSCTCVLSLYLLSVIWGVAFSCVAVNVLYCLCGDFCFLMLCCLLLCLVILLYYSNCIIIYLTTWYLLHIIICNTIWYRKKKAKRIMCCNTPVCNSPSLFYIKCVVCCRVHLWAVILLYLLLWSAVVSVCCSLFISTSYRGFAISPCCLVGWSEAHKLFAFWRSHDGILFIVLCVL